MKGWVWPMPGKQRQVDLRRSSLSSKEVIPGSVREIVLKTQREQLRDVYMSISGPHRHVHTHPQANQKTKKHTVVWMPVTKNKGEYSALVSTLAWTKACSKTRHGETRVK